MNDSPHDRLRFARISAGYQTAQEFADKHDIPQPTYQNHETGKRGLRLKTAKQYEKLLGNCDAAWLLTGHGKSPDGLKTAKNMASDGGDLIDRGNKRKNRPWLSDSIATFDFGANRSKAESLPIGPGEREFLARPRAVRVVGKVQAGVYLESFEFPGDEIYDVFIPIAPAYSKLSLLGIEVSGPSMNLLYPEGTVLICVDTIELGDGWMPEAGDRVIVRRRNKQGWYETTVKEYIVDQTGKHWLVPRSTEPEHQQPIPADKLADGDDDDEIRIVGLVIGSYRPERRR